MKIVGYYDTPFAAEVARTKLESEGIAAIVQNENLSNVLPYRVGMGSLRPYVTVADDDAQRAAEILELPAARWDVCPQCGSKDVVLRMAYRGRPMRSWQFVVLVLGLFNSGNLHRDCYCRSCGAWW